MPSISHRPSDGPSAARTSPARPARIPAPGFLRGFLILAAAGLVFLLAGSAARAAERTPQAVVVGASGTVEFLSEGATTWYVAGTNLVLYSGDQLRTGERSRAFLRLRDQSVLPVKEHSTLRFAAQADSVLVQLLRGVISFFHRDEPGSLQVESGGINAAIRGTEVAIALLEDGTTRVTVFDGEVELSDGTSAPLRLRSGDLGRARPGTLEAQPGRVVYGDWSPVQWALHYPTILDPADLGWDAPPDPALAPAWDAFRSGHLPRALSLYPAGRNPASPAEEVFLSALLLAGGDVEEADRRLHAVPSDAPVRPLADAHRRFIEVVRRGPASGALLEAAGTATPAGAGTPTERMADTYLLQASGRLADARDAALAAVERSPRFGVAWTRLAELEFSQGRRREAEAALDHALRETPEHAAARALQGFVLASANHLPRAEASFAAALALDPTLAQGWLGRGLCRIRRGRLAEGREALITAAALEPQSSILRSYLGKSLADSAPFRTPARPDKARAELDLARRLDPGDPTPWLYSALLNEQGNRVNDAIGDLRESQARNANRAIYRGGQDTGSESAPAATSLGLDQDLAVRGANLARVFADAGFQDIGVREASRAVNLDYANPAGHLFLANSYDLLRDPRQIDLRYETAAVGEYLVGNLLAPVGGGTLSRTVAHNEYSKLFERNRLGVANETLWTSNGDWYEQAAQFGLEGNVAYSLDAGYASELGERPNEDLELTALSATVHLQAAPSDTLLFQAGWYEAKSGDVLPRYDPSTAIAGLRAEERHEPQAYLGWNHEWQPGQNTLFLVSAWNSWQGYVNPEHILPFTITDVDGAIYPAYAYVPLASYETRYQGFTTELQHLWTLGAHTLVGGARYQNGAFDTVAVLDPSEVDPDIPTTSSVNPGMERFSLYAYDRWRLLPGLLLTAGVAWDRLESPLNFRSAPVTEGSDTLDQVGPKLGVEYVPWTGAMLRAAWTRSLGGVSIDQSDRLEPVQVAGFNQAFRSLIPESVAGSAGGQRMETLGVGFDQTFPTRTFFTLAAERLSSDATRDIGGLQYTLDGFQSVAAFREDLAFVENSLGAMVGQLVGRDLALSARYRIAEAQFDDAYPGIDALDPSFTENSRSVLQELTLGVRYQIPCGFFASWETRWSRQSNYGDVSALAGDDFWQHDAWIGWRFLQRRAEVAVGVVNLSDHDYQLHPLNYHAETRHERTLAITGNFAF